MDSFIHDFTIIWLDANHAQPDIFFDRPSILTSIISDLQTFTNASDCLEYLSSIPTDILVFLLVSGQLGEIAMPELENHSNICHVYVYCSNRERHENWTKQYSKIRAVYNDRTILLNQLTADVALHSKELSAPITLFKRDDLNKQERSIRNLSKESSMFMWFQLLFETLLQSKQTMSGRKEILNECKKEYQNNPTESSKIEEFERSYSSTEAVRWYTRDCFLFRLVNRAMRTQNIDIIYKYRSFLFDLHKQLTDLSIVTLNVSQVYRGQLMAFEEIEHMRANINGLISINTYFSTSIYSHIASGFSGGGLGRPHLESVIFTIKILPNMTDKPFAKIQDYSYISQEGEVLFSAGTVFRIIDISELTDGIWSVELELSSDIQEQWHDVMLYLRTEMAGRPTLVTLGNFLSEMGDLDKSEQYYHLLMNELENEEDTGAILAGIAAVHYRKSDFTRALDYCNQGLKQLTALSYIHADLATTYNLMGMIYLETNRLDDAMEYFQYALNVHDKTLPNNDPLTAADLNNMAMVDVRAHRFDMALSRFNRSMEIKRRVLPPDHPLIGHTYLNLGLLYAEQNKWVEAHSYYDKAIALQLKTLPATHPDLAISYANKARILVEEKQFDQALKLYEQALEIQLKRIPLCPSHLAHIYEQVGLIYIHTGDYIQVLHSFEKALQHQLECHASWDQLCQVRNNLGTAYYKTGDYLLALKEYEIALDLIPANDKSSKRYSTLNNIATIHLNMENYSIALDFYQKLIDILDHVDTFPSNANLVTIYQNIGLCYLAVEENDLALDYFARIRSLTENSSILSKIHSYIADAFLGQNEFTNAVENYELALKYDSSNEDFLIMTHNSIATAYHLSGDIHSALWSYQQALNIQLVSQSNDISGLAAAYSNIANVYWQAGNFTEAINYYTKQLELEIDPDIKHQIEEDIENIRQTLHLVTIDNSND